MAKKMKKLDPDILYPFHHEMLPLDELLFVEMPDQLVDYIEKTLTKNGIKLKKGDI